MRRALRIALLSVAALLLGAVAVSYIRPIGFAPRGKVHWELRDAELCRVSSAGSCQVSSSYAPVWLLLLAVASPALWVWCASRPPQSPTECIKCGYNLTGNVTGICPECGVPVRMAHER